MLSTCVSKLILSACHNIQGKLDLSYNLASLDGLPKDAAVTRRMPIQVSYIVSMPC